jgi:hypothetical protein
MLLAVCSLPARKVGRLKDLDGTSLERLMKKAAEQKHMPSSKLLKRRVGVKYSNAPRHTNGVSSQRARNTATIRPFTTHSTMQMWGGLRKCQAQQVQAL